MAAGEAGFTAPDLVTQYRAGRQRAVVATRPRLGRLAIGGADALDLLHRLSTNEVSTLRPGEGTATVLTTAKGRIVDLVILCRLADRLIALCGDDRARPVIDWIERYTFREEVTVDDLTASHGTLAIFGPQSAQHIDRVCGAGVPEPPEGFSRTAADGGLRVFEGGGEAVPSGGISDETQREDGHLLHLDLLVVHQVEEGGHQGGIPDPTGGERRAAADPWLAVTQEAIELTATRGTSVLHLEDATEDLGEGRGLVLRRGGNGDPEGQQQNP